VLPAVRAITDEHLKGIRDPHDTGSERNRLTFEATGITSPIKRLPMGVHNFRNLRERRHFAQYLEPAGRGFAYDQPLFRSQSRGFPKSL
jgi:hypothetical protein